MKLDSFLPAFLALATGINRLKGDDVDTEEEYRRINNVYKITYQKQLAIALKNRTSGCTLDNIKVRKEWSTIKEDHRRSYIQAIYCLASKPTTFPSNIMPGARTRYDDFTGTHLLQTPYIHFDGLFLPFHRYFMHLWETALHDECGYDGPTPYWDWTLSWNDPRKAAVFAGNDASFGSNGEYIPNRDPITITLPGYLGSLTFQPGTGGGCIQSGAFRDFKEHLGPVILEPQGPHNGTGYNPRCISRDISVELANNLRPSNLTTVLQTADLEELNLVLDAASGMHTMGHFHVGGIQIDPFVSPSDPIFWVHHGMIDYIWTIWQWLDIENRQNQVYGTGTTANVPPSPNVTLDSLIDFGILANPNLRRVGDMVSTIDGELCYMYD